MVDAVASILPKGGEEVGGLEVCDGSVVSCKEQFAVSVGGTHGPACAKAAVVVALDEPKAAVSLCCRACRNT